MSKVDELQVALEVEMRLRNAAIAGRDRYAELWEERKHVIEQCELARLKLLMCLENCIDLADGKEKSKQDFKLRLDEIKKTCEEAGHQRFQ